MRSSLGKTFGIEEPQIDSHVTTHSVTNVESISHEAPTDTKDEINVEPPIKIKRKSNLNHHTNEILHEVENKSQLIDEHFLEESESTENEPQLIDEHFLEEPASTDINLADPTES